MSRPHIFHIEPNYEKIGKILDKVSKKTRWQATARIQTKSDTFPSVILNRKSVEVKKDKGGQIVEVNFRCKPPKINEKEISFCWCLDRGQINGDGNYVESLKFECM